MNQQINQKRFLRTALALKVIMDCRTDKSCNLKKNLGLRLHDVINTKEQAVLKLIKVSFEGEDMQTQYSVLCYRIDLYLQLKLMNQDMLTEILVMKLKRKKRQKKNLIVIIKINPDEKNFNIFKKINKIYGHIKKSTKRSLLDDLSKRLLESEFKSSYSIKTKCLKWIVKKILPTIELMETHTIRNKTDKNWNKALFRMYHKK